MTGPCKIKGNTVIDTSTGEIVKILDAPSEKLMNIVHIIESNLNIKFTGSTQNEAWKFVNDNMAASKKARIEQKAKQDCRLDRISINAGFNSLSKHMHSVGEKHYFMSGNESFDDDEDYYEERDGWSEEDAIEDEHMRSFFDPNFG